MNNIKINVVRIATLILLGVILKIVFREDPVLNVYERLLIELIFLGVPFFFAVRYWSKAETMHDEYKKERKREELEQYNSEFKKYDSNKIRGKNSTISKIIILIAAIATIIGTLVQILK